MTALPIDHIIDLERYPLSKPESPAYLEMLQGVHAQLAKDGCAILKGFLRPEIIEALVAEADRVSPFAHRSFNKTNAYFTQDNDALPESHPVRRFYERSNAFIPADNFGPESLLRQVFEWEAFAPFAQEALQEEKFFAYADPLADVIINLVEPGGGFPWHFDTNNFTITLAIRNGEGGGAFEYVPNIRTSEAENYEAVQEVLEGDRSRVVSINLEPGDLQIFRGRYSLHRVTPVEGKQDRYVGIFSFVEEPGMVATPERCKQLYGRVLPIHYERAGLRADRLLD